MTSIELKPGLRCVIRSNGTVQMIHEPRTMTRITRMLGCDIPQTVDLRSHGLVMIVDDLGHLRTPPLPRNEQATQFYHSICKPGTTHWIAGDAYICPDDDFSEEDDE